jgi:hypothetical protein
VGEEPGAKKRKRSSKLGNRLPCTGTLKKRQRSSKLGNRLPYTGTADSAGVDDSANMDATDNDDDESESASDLKAPPASDANVRSGSDTGTGVGAEPGAKKRKRSSELGNIVPRAVVQTISSKPKVFTARELDLLKLLIEKHGPGNWRAKANVFPGRDAKALRQKWWKLSKDTKKPPETAAAAIVAVEVPYADPLSASRTGVATPPMAMAGSRLGVLVGSLTNHVSSWFK